MMSDCAPDASPLSAESLDSEWTPMSDPLSGAEVIAEIRRRTDTILLAFSCGKDSIGTWLECRKHFPRIVPYYMYLVPDLEFVERSIRYYEGWFGSRIIRVPHPSLHRMLNNLVFQPPERCAIIEAAGLDNFDYTDMADVIRLHAGLGDECLTASGVRAVDSPYRMISLRKNGAISEKNLQFFPIWDWRKDRLLATIQASGIALPADYRLFGRSFDGIDYRFLAPIKQHFPRDYARILEWFPLADLEIKRREYAAQI